VGLLGAFGRRPFLTESERAQLRDGLAHAERHAGAPIALRIEARASGNPEVRAAVLFAEWDLPDAARGRAVLVYACEASRTFAVQAGPEVLAVSPPGFWRGLHADLTRHFSEARYCDGLFKAIADISIQLRQRFGPVSASTTDEAETASGLTGPAVDA
jgi:uncharacterized membrane protein